MKQKQISISYQVFHSTDELSIEDAQLLEAAKAALQLSYSPYSEFRVGAAVLLENGAIVSGANQENAAYPMCLCAEQVALAAVASQHPGVTVKKMAITVKCMHLCVNMDLASEIKEAGFVSRLSSIGAWSCASRLSCIALAAHLM